MSRLRVLYLDVPFENEPGGDKNRSRFLWHSLRERFETDLVLIGREGTTQRPAWTKFKPRAWLPPQPAPFPRSESTPAFAPEDRARFSALLREGNYDVVFSRFCRSWELLGLVERDSPRSSVVVDVDMLSSRLAGLSWQARPGFRSRWYLFEKWKLTRFERRMFREPWLFLFTNPVELPRQTEPASAAAAEFALVPNVMPVPSGPIPIACRRAILFFGSLDSAANQDAFQFLLDDLLPRIQPDLDRHGIEIRVVGKNPPARFRERLAQNPTLPVKLVGEVASIEGAIAESLFVLLPLRIASGTRTRILEAAAQRRAVVTTSIGKEGLDLDGAVRVGDTADDLAGQVRHLLDHPAEAQALGEELQRRCLANYSAEKVARDLCGFVEKVIARRRSALAA